VSAVSLAGICELMALRMEIKWRDLCIPTGRKDKIALKRAISRSYVHGGWGTSIITGGAILVRFLC